MSEMEVMKDEGLLDFYITKAAVLRALNGLVIDGFIKKMARHEGRIKYRWKLTRAGRNLHRALIRDLGLVGRVMASSSRSVLAAYHNNRAPLGERVRSPFEGIYIRQRNARLRLLARRLNE